MTTIEALNKLYNLKGTDTLVHVSETLREALRVLYQNHDEIYGCLPELPEVMRLVRMSMNPKSKSVAMDAVVDSVIRDVDLEYDDA